MKLLVLFWSGKLPSDLLNSVYFHKLPCKAVPCYTRLSTLNKREDILEKVERTEKQAGRVRAVFRFDKRLPNLNAIFRRNWQTMLDDDQRLSQVYPNPPMVCFRRGRNIRESLCQARLPPARVNRQEGGFRRCRRSQCRLCPYTNLGPVQVPKSVQISSTGEELPITSHLTCLTTNLIYIGSCVKGDRTCPDKPQYCGETGKSAEERFVGHRNSVVQLCQEGTNLPVGHHFRGVGHSV